MQNLNPDVEIRQATRADLDAFYGKPWQHSARCWIVFWKGQPACVAGLVVGATGACAFSDVKPEIKVHPIIVCRVARHLAKLLGRKNLKLRATTENPRFLEMLGFKASDGQHSGMLVYEWGNQ